MIVYEQGPEDQEKEVPDQYVNEAPPKDPSMNEVYEVPERKGDEALQPPKLKTLPEELKYDFLD